MTKADKWAYKNTSVTVSGVSRLTVKLCDVLQQKEATILQTNKT
jgi:hypothetical protein